jgi:hypothetical protein
MVVCSTYKSFVSNEDICKVFFVGAVSTHAFLDQVPNKRFALLAAGQFETRLQEFGL